MGLLDVLISIFLCSVDSIVPPEVRLDFIWTERELISYSEALVFDSPRPILSFRASLFSISILLKLSELSWPEDCYLSFGSDSFIFDTVRTRFID